jgi:DNA-binding NtrC family response regulator
LRERKEDIPLLAEHFIGIFSKKAGKTNPALSPAAMERIMAYEYPGNVRELRHAIEMAVTYCTGNIIGFNCLPAELKGDETGKGVAILTREDLSLPERVRALEREIIAETLEETSGKKKEAAKKLKISRETLWRKLKEHGFPVPPSDLSDLED